MHYESLLLDNTIPSIQLCVLLTNRSGVVLPCTSVDAIHFQVGRGHLLRIMGPPLQEGHRYRPARVNGLGAVTE
jgi:hypothetical protein